MPRTRNANKKKIYMSLIFTEEEYEIINKFYDAKEVDWGRSTSTRRIILNVAKRYLEKVEMQKKAQEQLQSQQVQAQPIQIQPIQAQTAQPVQVQAQEIQPVMQEGEAKPGKYKVRKKK